MRIGNRHYQAIWADENRQGFHIIDQRFLPHQLKTLLITDYRQALAAIRDMAVRGAPLIGVTAAYGIWLAAKEAAAKKDPVGFLENACLEMSLARPTAVNLQWATERMSQILSTIAEPAQWDEVAFLEAAAIEREETATCRQIGEHGLPLIEEIFRNKKGKEPVNILTHCNAGWLACVDYGTATAPIYLAQERGIRVHVWVSETRPRLQGANLTAFEMGAHGVAHTLVTDNACGWLLAEGKVDLCLVGTDRVAQNGDVANKIGTYLKALAAKENDRPFYVAAPSSSIDGQISSGSEIPIEFRSETEVTQAEGFFESQNCRVNIAPEKTNALNPGFDITPAKWVTGLITERGICPASKAGLLKLFPEKFAQHGRE